MTVLVDVERDLNDAWRTSLQIWRSMNLWSPVSVGRACEQLHAAGKAERETRETNTGTVHYYRRRYRLPGARS